MCGITIEKRNNNKVDARKKIQIKLIASRNAQYLLQQNTVNAKNGNLLENFFRM